MRVCFILEGCYPYIRGGVSAWAHEYMTSNPQIEFVLWTIHAARKYTGEPLYKLPENVVECREIYLEDALKSGGRGSSKNYGAYIDSLKMILGKDGADFGSLLENCSGEISADNFVESEEFYAFARKFSLETGTGLSDAYHGLKSIFMPLLFLLGQDVPNADLYHSAVAGYGGILGALAKYKTGRPFVLTEHGIYPREREEELIQADWVAPSMREIWIRSFYQLSKCAYSYADRVTALFSDASAKQTEIGCDKEKCSVVSNGIHIENFESIPVREESDGINIGAFVRFAPIKDVKTLIYAFYHLRKRVPNAELYLMGGTDDETYRDECLELLERLNLSNIRVEGYVDTALYMSKMDFTVMTSISEGQPLAILESLAASRPCVSTKVGNCPELLGKSADGFGEAGICCTPMDISGIAAAMEKLCNNRELRLELGRNGRERVRMNYTYEKMNSGYLKIYKDVL